MLDYFMYRAILFIGMVTIMKRGDQRLLEVLLKQFIKEHDESGPCVCVACIGYRLQEEGYLE